jgi:hypothetical protein
MGFNIWDPFGMGESHAKKFTKKLKKGGESAVKAGKQGLKDRIGVTGMKEEARLANSSELAEAMQQYGSGEIDLQKALQSSVDPRIAARNVAMDPLTGSKMATEQVRDNPLFSGTFGEGGLQERMLAEEQELASRGYQLQPEDHEAFGQASDETARLFAQEEGALAQALAERGLATAPSGAAGVGFSGIMGNKLERLASSQRKIAADRMEMNRQRLDDVRARSLQASQQAGGLLQDQFGRNQAGVKDYREMLRDSAGAQRQQLEHEGMRTDIKMKEESMEGPGLADVLGGAASIGLGAMTGGAGTALGAAAGSSLAGALGGGAKPQVQPTPTGAYGYGTAGQKRSPY